MTQELAVIEQHLTTNLEAISRAAARGIDPERLIRIVLTSLQGDGVILQKCTRESVLLACLNAAAIGLEPTGFLGDAYLIPFGDKCNLIIGYKGLIKLMKRTGEVTRVEAHEVWNCDEFDYRYGTDPGISHKPGHHEDRSEMVAAYAVAWMRDGSQQFEVMTPDEIAKVKSVSKASRSNASPWSQFEAMMWRKSAVRRLSNYVELSSEAQAAIAYDDRATIGETISVSEIDPTDLATNDVAQKVSEARTADLTSQLETANEKLTIKKEIAATIKGVGWPVDAVPHFVQTVLGTGAEIVDMDHLDTDDWTKVLDGINKAIEMHKGGGDVTLTMNDDKHGVYILPSKQTIEA